MGALPQIPTPKESFSSFLAHTEQQNLLLKKQQQQSSQVQRKTYESMIADLSKVADFSSKISSYSHEAKVCLCHVCIELYLQIIGMKFCIHANIPYAVIDPSCCLVP
jgi:hypothetical protein